MMTRRDLARLISHIENGEPQAEMLLQQLRPRAGKAHVVGLTGAPGAGKSTLVAALTKAIRVQHRTVAIISVDPSSPFSGGAILGDRIRMGELSGDPGVFIRSMASRGASGGIASTTADVCTALDAFGHHVVIIETVGAGQSEVEVARLAQTVVVVEAPGMGDDVQAIKAGIVEIADILVVNKADKPEAEQTANALQLALDLAQPSYGHHGVSALGSDAIPSAAALSPSDWRVPVLKTVAATGEGIAGVVEHIDAHRLWLAESGEGERRKLRRSREEVFSRLRELLMRRALKALHWSELEGMYRSVAAGELTAAEVAQMIADKR
jgi:LAO/AO transport system kinase